MYPETLLRNFEIASLFRVCVYYVHYCNKHKMIQEKQALRYMRVNVAM